MDGPRLYSTVSWSTDPKSSSSQSISSNAASYWGSLSRTRIRSTVPAAAVVAPDRDRIGLLVAQKLAASGAADRILVRLNDPEYEAAFDDIDCELLDFGSVLHETVESHLGPTPA